MPRGRQAADIPPGLVGRLGPGSAPAYRQVYELIRQAILRRDLTPDMMLPSSQALANELGVSRGTIVQAYDMLVSEGYLVGVTGSGTYVSQFLPEEYLPSSPSPDSTRYEGGRFDLSERGKRLLSVPVAPWSDLSRVRRPFESVEHMTNLFPLDTWATLARRRYRTRERDWLHFGEPAGYRPLRQALADHARSSRGAVCTTDQVMVFSGLASAMTFLAQVLTDPGDPVWIESYSDLQPAASLRMAGAQIIPIPIDEEGLDVAAGKAVSPDARLAFVTPSCQTLMGMTMSMPRRLALLQWAREHDAWIIENDDNGEFRYRGRPLSALQGLDPNGRTVYMATFNTVMYPSLRLAFAIVPESLIDRFTRARALFDVHSPVFEQMVLADFITEGHFQRQIRRLRRLQAERQRVLLDAAASELAGLLELRPIEAGLHLVGWLPDGVSEVDAQQAAAAHGVSVDPLDVYRYQSSVHDRPGLVLGFTAFEPDEIRAGVSRLAAALKPLVHR